MENQDWIATLISVINSYDISIVACIVSIIFFMKYDNKTQQTGHKCLALCLGISLILLVLFRIGVGIYQGFYI
jgi:hypothetical protein